MGDSLDEHHRHEGPSGCYSWRLLQPRVPVDGQCRGSAPLLMGHLSLGGETSNYGEKLKPGQKAQLTARNRNNSCLAA